VNNEIRSRHNCAISPDAEGPPAAAGAAGRGRERSDALTALSWIEDAFIRSNGSSSGSEAADEAVTEALRHPRLRAALLYR
jgi:hypothetical protein